MSIYLDEPNGLTICKCDGCGETQSSTPANGVVSPGWMTGHLWLDIELSRQKQFPICFCPTCSETRREADSFLISPAV